MIGRTAAGLDEIRGSWSQSKKRILQMQSRERVVLIPGGTGIHHDRLAGPPNSVTLVRRFLCDGVCVYRLPSHHGPCDPRHLVRQRHGRQARGLR